MKINRKSYQPALKRAVPSNEDAVVDLILTDGPLLKASLFNTKDPHLIYCLVRFSIDSREESSLSIEESHFLNEKSPARASASRGSRIYENHHF